MSQSDNPHYLDYWHEVTNTINKLIKLTYPITRDRMEKLKIRNTSEDQLFHIIEEVIEYQQELLKAKYDKADWKAIDNENLDILFAWLALQHVINQNAGIDQHSIASVLIKFQERGWLNFKK